MARKTPNPPEPPGLEGELKRIYGDYNYIKRYIRDGIAEKTMVGSFFIIEVIINNFANGEKKLLDEIIKTFYDNSQTPEDINNFFSWLLKLDKSYTDNLTVTPVMVEKYINGSEMPMEWILLLENEES